ncbi:hypothetical protein B0H11DRAFT_2094975 [Mycena galericulata]|nr:hypothetical protein B0H11DRAFT_2094975 [Mycena galericulata]
MPVDRVHYKNPRSDAPKGRSRRPVTRQPVTRQQDHAVSLYGPTPDNILQFRLALGEANARGDILTWSPATNSLEPAVWEPPVRMTSDGNMTQWGASAYNNLPADTLEAPHCPHAINPFVLAEYSLMSANWTKKRGWFFKAEAHECEFIVNIPPLGSRKPKDSEEDAGSVDLDAGHWADTDDEDESFELMALDREAAEKVRKVNADTASKWPPPYSPGTPLPPYMSSSPIPSTSSTPSRPQPTPSNGGIRSMVSKTSAEQRFCLDPEFRNRLQDRHASGLYTNHPYEHPAWNSLIEECIPLMASFHPATPGSYAPSMMRMTTLCGQMLTQLNSTMGLPQITFFRLLLQKLDCDVCGCIYSVEGYHDHRQFRAKDRTYVCVNTPDLFPIQERQPDLAGLYDMATRTYPTGSLPSHSDHIDTAIGRAWVTWNSRVGVTKDVWPDCDLVRTFEGDRAHRDENLMCRDVGQGQVGTVLGGLHRVSSAEGAMVVWKMA